MSRPNFNHYDPIMNARRTNWRGFKVWEKHGITVDNIWSGFPERPEPAVNDVEMEDYWHLFMNRRYNVHAHRSPFNDMARFRMGLK